MVYFGNQEETIRQFRNVNKHKIRVIRHCIFIKVNDVEKETNKQKGKCKETTEDQVGKYSD